MDVDTAWVKPPPQVGGLDHLAIQAPCINIYGRLLPGITNVTDRARYYSFYPWLIWAFDKRGYTQYNHDFVERFRRADCLLSLIAARHSITSGGEYEDHAGAMVGTNTLGAVARELGDGGRVKLSDYSLREGAKKRYFMNKLGGLGQYYIGVLRELSVLDGDSTNGVKYTRQIGQVIAESASSSIDQESFFNVVESDSVTAEDLDALSGLCPCQLSNNPEEQKILGELFFARDLFVNEEALPRRRSLQSILQLSQLLYKEGIELSEMIFKACSYSGSLPSGVAWPVLKPLAGNRQKWAIYARNEYLSNAVQGLFFVLLDAYEASEKRFDTGDKVVSWFLGTDEAKEALVALGANRNFSDCVEEAKRYLPAIENWSDSDHEVQLAELVVQLSRARKSAGNRRDIVIAAIKIIIALSARESPEENPYGDIVFDDSYFQYYPINLRSFHYHLKSTWTSMTLEQVLRWVQTAWGIDVHLRVALRKLRGQSQSTFRIRPSDRGLEVMAVPPAVHTRPRFNQAVRILKDIGALEKSESGLWRPSSFGQSLGKVSDVG